MAELVQKLVDFGASFDRPGVHDVTSTYFEGETERNPQARRGYSRDQRSGNKQVCIGPVCTPEGLPLTNQVDLDALTPSRWTPA